MRVRHHYGSNPRDARDEDPVSYREYAVGAGPLSVGNPANMTFLDVGCGMPLGWNGERPCVPRASSLDEARSRVWSRAFGPAPCYIPFSGGRESSMWLATATSYARRNGHDDPIPVTLRYPGLASTEMLELQELVIDHLGLADWARVEAEDLDLIGPVARATLARTGPLWPPNAYLMAPLIEAVSDGLFVLASGLIDFFAWWRWGALAEALTGHRRPNKRDLALLARALSPASRRADTLRRRAFPPPMPWLRPAAESQALALWRRRQVSAPVRFDRAMVTQVTHRCFDGAASTFNAIGEALGTPIDQPLRRPGVVEAIAGAGGWRGFRSPRELLHWVCGELLPPEVLTPRPAPDLTHIFFGDASRDFARHWSGAGLDESVIDVVALRRNWLSERPDSRTACLLQYAWLTEQISRTGSPRQEPLVILSHNKEAP